MGRDRFEAYEELRVESLDKTSPRLICRNASTRSENFKKGGFITRVDGFDGFMHSGQAKVKSLPFH
jgi:hypothetical protein